QDRLHPRDVPLLQRDLRGEESAVVGAPPELALALLRPALRRARVHLRAPRPPRLVLRPPPLDERQEPAGDEHGEDDRRGGDLDLVPPEQLPEDGPRAIALRLDRLAPEVA